MKNQGKGVEIPSFHSLQKYQILIFLTNKFNALWITIYKTDIIKSDYQLISIRYLCRNIKNA